MLRLLAIIILVSFFTTSCESKCLSKKEVKDMINREITIDDSRVKVESTLDKLGIGYSYDRFRDRYQSTIRPESCESNKAISVYIYLNKLKKVTKIEIFESFTMP